MWKRALVPVACGMLLASVCLGEVKRIRLKDGRVLVGDVIERTDDGVKIKVKLGVLSFSKDQIESIEDVLDPKAEYKQRLAKIDQKSPDAHVALGQWAMDNKLLEEARDQFKAALNLKKDHERAALLLRLVEAKIKQSKTSGNGGSTTVVRPIGPVKPPFDPKVLIEMEDIYRIRLAEVRKDERVSAKFKNDVIDRFIRKMRGREEFREPGFVRTFRGYSRARQARYMISKLGPDDPMRSDILIESDPQFMRDFRRVIWRYVSTSCASTQCHGAKKGKGKLKLYNYPGQNDRVDYTNFLILEAFRRRGGLQMIDRDRAAQSLLVQYALPAEQARSRHPEKIPPAFRNRNAAAYRRAVQWITELEGPPHPGYNIKKLPPYVMKRETGLPGIRDTTSKPTTRPGKEEVVPF